MKPLDMFPLAVRLALGGRRRLEGLAALWTLIRTDAARHIGEQEAHGADVKESLEAYREWVHDHVDAALDELLATLEPRQ